MEVGVSGAMFMKQPDGGYKPLGYVDESVELSYEGDFGDVLGYPYDFNEAPVGFECKAKLTEAGKRFIDEEIEKLEKIRKALKSSTIVIYGPYELGDEPIIVYYEDGCIDWEASGIAEPNTYGEGRDTVPDCLLDKWTDLCDIAEQQWETQDD